MNLASNQVATAPDPVLIEAARLMQHEQYNSLATGRGKDVTIQLLRTCTAAGYPLEKGLWLAAFYSVGGDFDEAEHIAKFIKEMKAGVRHRVKPALRPEILEVLRERVKNSSSESYSKSVD